MSFALETPVIVSPEDKRKLIVDVLPRLGANQQECSIQADVLTEGDLRGHHSHGLQRVPVLATHIKKGLIRVNINRVYVDRGFGLERGRKRWLGHRVGLCICSGRPLHGRVAICSTEN